MEIPRKTLPFHLGWVRRIRLAMRTDVPALFLDSRLRGNDGSLFFCWRALHACDVNIETGYW